jgi:hypothetical protein
MTWRGENANSHPSASQPAIHQTRSSIEFKFGEFGILSADFQSSTIASTLTSK